MKIDHIALYVSDLEKSKEFYVKYFGGVSNSKYYNIKTGLQSYFLSFEGDARLEIMTRPDCTKSDKYECMSGFTHLSFSTGSKGKVVN